MILLGSLTNEVDVQFKMIIKINQVCFKQRPKDRQIHLSDYQNDIIVISENALFLPHCSLWRPLFTCLSPYATQSPRIELQALCDWTNCEYSEFSSFNLAQGSGDRSSLCPNECPPPLGLSVLLLNTLGLRINSVIAIYLYKIHGVLGDQKRAMIWNKCGFVHLSNLLQAHPLSQSIILSLVVRY